MQVAKGYRQQQKKSLNHHILFLLLVAQSALKLSTDRYFDYCYDKISETYNLSF